MTDMTMTASMAGNANGSLQDTDPEAWLMPNSNHRAKAKPEPQKMPKPLTCEPR